MTDGHTEQAIKKILDRLFTDGRDDKADRLLLIQEPYSGAAQVSYARYLGGYSKAAVRDIVADALMHYRENTFSGELVATEPPPTELRAAVRQLVMTPFPATSIADRSPDECLDAWKEKLVDRISTFVAERELARDERAAGIAGAYATKTAQRFKGTEMPMDYHAALEIKESILDLDVPRVASTSESVSGSDSTHVEAIRQARLEALEEAVQVARHATLPRGYQYGREAMENFNFGKERAVKAIRALGEST